VKQRPPFLRVVSGITSYQLHHRLLHQIERVIRVAGGDARRHEGAPLDTGEKTVQGVRGVQGLLPIA